jgi:hypothetical protein
MAVTLSCHSPCVGDQPIRRIHLGSVKSMIDGGRSRAGSTVFVW